MYADERTVSGTLHTCMYVSVPPMAMSRMDRVSFDQELLPESRTRGSAMLSDGVGCEKTQRRERRKGGVVESESVRLGRRACVLVVFVAMM